MTIKSITVPIIELLAIKLFEHHTNYHHLALGRGWLKLQEAERNVYRSLARGEFSPHNFNIKDHTS